MSTLKKYFVFWGIILTFSLFTAPTYGSGCGCAGSQIGGSATCITTQTTKWVLVPMLTSVFTFFNQGSKGVLTALQDPDVMNMCLGTTLATGGLFLKSPWALMGGGSLFVNGVLAKVFRDWDNSLIPELPLALGSTSLLSLSPMENKLYERGIQAYALTTWMSVILKVMRPILHTAFQNFYSSVWSGMKEKREEKVSPTHSPSLSSEVGEKEILQANKK